MAPSFQSWLFVVFLALILSLAVQISLMVVFIRLLTLLRRAAGGPGLREIFDQALQAATDVDRAARAACETLEQIDRQVRHAASISERRLADADRVAGQVLATVERINRNVGTVTNWPFREVFAWSAGLRSASITLFHKRPNSSERRQG